MPWVTLSGIKNRISSESTEVSYIFILPFFISDYSEANIRSALAQSLVGITFQVLHYCRDFSLQCTFLRRHLYTRFIRYRLAISFIPRPSSRYPFQMYKEGTPRILNVSVVHMGCKNAGVLNQKQFKILIVAELPLI